MLQSENILSVRPFYKGIFFKKNLLLKSISLCVESKTTIKKSHKVSQLWVGGEGGPEIGTVSQLWPFFLFEPFP